MSVRIFNKAHRTFLLEAGDGTSRLVPPLAFAEIEEKFTGDITYKKAVAAGELEPFNTTKQGDKLEEKAHAPQEQKPATVSKPATQAKQPAAARGTKGVNRK